MNAPKQCTERQNTSPSGLAVFAKGNIVASSAAEEGRLNHARKLGKVEWVETQRLGGGHTLET